MRTLLWAVGGFLVGHLTGRAREIWSQMKSYEQKYGEVLWKNPQFWKEVWGEMKRSRWS
jgi:hypothetical protein